MREQIFTCEDVNWTGLETLMQELSSKKSGVVETSEISISLPLLPQDLVVIYDHAAGCTKCGARLISLSSNYGITSGDIFQTDSTNLTTPKS